MATQPVKFRDNKDWGRNLAALKADIDILKESIPPFDEKNPRAIADAKTRIALLCNYIFKADNPFNEIIDDPDKPDKQFDPRPNPQSEQAIDIFAVARRGVQEAHEEGVIYGSHARALYNDLSINPLARNAYALFGQLNLEEAHKEQPGLTPYYDALNKHLPSQTDGQRCLKALFLAADLVQAYEADPSLEGTYRVGHAYRVTSAVNLNSVFKVLENSSSREKIEPELDYQHHCLDLTSEATPLAEELRELAQAVDESDIDETRIKLQKKQLETAAKVGKLFTAICHKNDVAAGCHNGTIFYGQNNANFTKLRQQEVHAPFTQFVLVNRPNTLNGVFQHVDIEDFQLLLQCAATIDLLHADEGNSSDPSFSAQERDILTKKGLHGGDFSIKVKGIRAAIYEGENSLAAKIQARFHTANEEAPEAPPSTVAAPIAMPAPPLQAHTAPLPRRAGKHTNWNIN